MQWLKALVTFLVLSCAWPSFAIVIVGFDGEPFYFKNGSEGIAGACHDIMQRVCDREKIHCKFKIAPLSVVLEMIKSGKADVACPLAETPARRTDIYFSNKIFKTNFAYFGTPEVAKKVTSLKDLANLSVSVFTPSRVSESLEGIQAESPVKFEIIKENSNYSTLMRAEKISKVLAYINQEIGTRWIKKTHSPLIQAPLMGEQLSYHIAFSRKNFDDAKLAHYSKVLDEVINTKEAQEASNKLGLSLYQNESPSVIPASAPAISPKSSPTPLKEKTPEENSEGL